MGRGGVLAVSEKSSLNVTNTTFHEVFAYSGGVAYIVEFSQLILKDIHFTYLNAAINLFDCTSSTFVIENSQISQSQTNIFFLMNSNFRLVNMTIDNHNCDTIFQGCLIFALSESFLVINQIYVTQMISQTTDNIFLSSGTAILDNIIMKNLNTFNMQGSCIGAFSSKVKIKNAFFSLFYGNCMNFYESLIDLDNSFFEKNVVSSKLMETKGVFYCLNCLSYNITQNVFRNNEHANSLYLKYKYINEVKNNTFLNTIINCTFVANVADQYGGAIYFENQMTLIENSTFIENRANIGGAIFIYIDGKNILFIFYKKIYFN